MDEVYIQQCQNNASESTMPNSIVLKTKPN